MKPSKSSDRLHDTYRELVVNAPDAILVVSNGKLLFANPAAADLVGLPDPESLLERDVLDFTPAESRQEIVRLIQQLHANPRALSLVETQLLRVDGRKRDIELMTCPTTYEGAKASIVFVRDVTDRKRAERDLRASEERYRQVVESMNEALVVYDSDANVKFVNQQFCEMFECEPTVIGKPPSDFFAPQTALLVKQNIERRRKGLHERYEAPLTVISGKTIVAQVSAAPLLHDGKFAGSLALVTDISDRHLAQQRLRKSEQRYQELVDGSPYFIFSFDCDDRYTAANKTVCDTLGLSEEQILGRTFEEVGIPVDVAREWREQMKAVRDTRQTQTRETIVSFQRSAPRMLRRTISPMYGEDGTLIGLSGLSIDITDQKASEEKNQKLLRAIEEMDEVMFTTDAAGVITYVNPAFERIYGFTRDEAVGSTPRIIKSGEMDHDVYGRFWQEVNAGRTTRTEFVNRRKDGQLVRMIVSVSPIHGEDGRLTGFTAVQRDVTLERRAEEERRQLESQLAHSAKMQALGTLAGGIAHDFNNILSVVLTHATLADMSKNNATRMTEAIATIKRAVTRGAGLSRQILTFARKTEVKFAKVDVNRVAREIGSMVREMFPRNIDIDLDLDSDPLLVRADADQMHQALLNLFLNARDAMSNGGTLRLSTQGIGRNQVRKSFSAALDCDHVRLRVSDSGHGMSSETVSRIFEPFFTTKEVGKGSGLGLAVVYGIMKAHEGWIDVSSEPGRGSTFELYFPANLAATADEDADDSQKFERGTETLLLIEDEREIAAALSYQLTDRGYRVISAHNADEGMRKLLDPANAFDVIITDLGIPGISPRDLMKLLGTTAPAVPLIPMTGYVDPELHRDVFAAGTQPILEKPFTIDQLLRRIRDAVNSRAQRVS